MKHAWNTASSLILTTWAIRLFKVVGITMAIFAWPISKWMCAFSRAPGIAQVPVLFTVTLYIGFALAFPCLVFLEQLVKNISKGQVFCRQNIIFLRRISWCCFAAAVLCIVSALYYAPWFVVALAAVFMALIIRVIKNVFEQAQKIKDENDYTI
ncbi:MAG: DUF2975 domain-containing protein [Oscillospiraceae bacterium]|nr:DUF2975 domain-containing protein [Oscillospiraceae bacterium]